MHEPGCTIALHVECKFSRNQEDSEVSPAIKSMAELLIVGLMYMIAHACTQGVPSGLMVPSFS